MACEFELTVNAGQYGEVGSHALAALDLIDELESQMTVFRETSEVMDSAPSTSDGVGLPMRAECCRRVVSAAG